MAVAQDAIAGSIVNASGQATPWDSTPITVGASATGLLVIFTYASAITITSVTWDQGGTNQSLTQINTVAASSQIIEMWGLAGAVTSGLKTLRIVFSGATLSGHLFAISYTGTGTTFVTAFTNSHTNTAGSGTPSNTVTGGTANDIVVDAAASAGSISAPSNTQLALDNTGTVGLGVQNAAPGSSPITFTWSGAGAFGDVGIVVTATAVAAATLMGAICL